MTMLRRLLGLLAVIAGSAALALLFALVFACHFVIWPAERVQRGAMILIDWILAAAPR